MKAPSRASIILSGLGFDIEEQSMPIKTSLVVGKCV